MPRLPQPVFLEELFITTKLRNNSKQGYDTTPAAFDESMNKLNLDVLDLFLIHWPPPMFDQYGDVAGLRTSASSPMSGCGPSSGRTSRLNTLERLIAETDVTPSVNQVELHPEFLKRSYVSSMLSTGS